MARRLVTEQEVRSLAAGGNATISLEQGSLVTPAAADAAKQLGVKIVTGKSAPAPGVTGVKILPPESGKNPGDIRCVAIGSDHGGLALKQTLTVFLTGLGIRVMDVGTFTKQACDYPDFALAVARLVASGDAAAGIMIDSVGVASAIAANKVQGIRAVPCYSEFVARSSREHNNANVLTLGGKVTGVEHAKSIVQAWLATAYAGGRHEARVKKISDIEHHERHSGSS